MIFRCPFRAIRIARAYGVNDGLVLAVQGFGAILGDIACASQQR